MMAGEYAIFLLLLPSFISDSVLHTRTGVPLLLCRHASALCLNALNFLAIHERRFDFVCA